MKKIFILSLTFFFYAAIANGQSGKAGGDEQSIRNLIEQQRTAWNKGDLETFMETYWQNDSLMFIGKSGVTYGWQNTLSNYKKGYPDTATMGKLDFDLQQIKRLSAIYFFVAGKWHLTRTTGDVGGHFTLLFKKFKNKWVIVADHSS